MIGAWSWLDQLDIGLATEIDLAEALQPYHAMRTLVLGALGGIALLALLLTALTVWIGQRARRLLRLLDSQRDFETIFRNALVIDDRHAAERAAVETLFSRLHEMLQDADAEAVVIMEQLTTMLGGHPVGNTVKEMARAIKAYDFDRALELFDKTIDF